MAELCGVQVGEVLLAINGASIVGISHDSAIGLLKQSGNEVEFILQRFM